MLHLRLSQEKWHVPLLSGGLWHVALMGVERKQRGNSLTLCPF